MGHVVDRTRELFSKVIYGRKSAEELREAMGSKLEKLRAKIAEREQRMLDVRAEYDIGAERLATLVMQYRDRGSNVSYDAQRLKEDEVVVPAGIIANLIREREMIDNELEQITKLELVIRNLCEKDTYLLRSGEVVLLDIEHVLNDFELEYLGF